MITIRRFIHEDAESLQNILYPEMSLGDISDMIDEWSTCVCRGRVFEMFAIISDEKIVGSVSLYEHSKSVASLGAEVITEERCKGAASEAVSLLLHYAAKKHYRIILDQVRKDNTASIRLHEKLGFESDGYVYRNQRDQEVVLYLKSLS